MKTFEKLRKKILIDTGIRVISFERTYAGRNQKQAGAVSWIGFLEDKSTVSGYDTATELLKAGKLEWRRVRGTGEIVIE